MKLFYVIICLYIFLNYKNNLQFTYYQMQKYNATSVKMLVNALDDVVMIKFKAGWFTLIKYDYQVGELKNPKPREELLEFVKKVREEGEDGEYKGLKKPDTWMTHLDLKIENKFKKEAEGGSNIPSGIKDSEQPASAYTNTITPLKGAQSAARPQSQSKIAQKRARQQAALKAGQSGGSGGRPGLQLPSFKKNLKLKLGGDAVDKDDDVKQPSATDSSVKPIEKEITQPPSSSLANNSPRQPAVLKVESVEKLRNPTAASNPPQQVAVEYELKSEPKIAEKEEKSKQPSAKSLNSAPKKESPKLENPNKPEQAQKQQPASSKLSERDIKFQEVMKKMEKREYFKKVFDSSIQCTIHEKKLFVRYKQFVRQSRRDEFIHRIKVLDFRSQRSRPLRRAFDKLKVNSLGKEVQMYTQDKFQYYLKYVRKLCNILNTSGLSNPQVAFQKKFAFHQWRSQTYSLCILQDKANHLRELNDHTDDPNLLQEAKTQLIDSVYLHKESINWLQNDNVVYLKELKMQNYNSQNVDTSARQLIAAFQNSSVDQSTIVECSQLSENKARFYALVFSKIETIYRMNMITSFDRIWAEGLGGDPSLASIDNSLHRLLRIRRHIAYLRKVKNSVESRYSTAKLVQPLTNNIGQSVYGGSIQPPSLSLVAPGTSVSANDKLSMRIQIETPGQPHNRVGPLALPVDPQLSVDSRQSFNAFENSGNRHGATPVGPPAPLNPQITNSNQTKPARTPNGPWEGSLIVPATDDGSQGAAELTPVVVETTDLTPVQAVRVETASTNQFQLPFQQQKTGLPADRDAIFLYHIERQLSENVGLVKLYRGLKVLRVDDNSNSAQEMTNYNQFYKSDLMEQQEIDKAIEENKQKAHSIKKIAKLKLHLDTLSKKREDADFDIKAVAAAFSRWESAAMRDQLLNSKQEIRRLRTEKYKSAIQTLNQHFNANTRSIEQAFDRWKNAIVLERVSVGGGSWIQPYGLDVSRQLTPSAAGQTTNPDDYFQGPQMIIQDQRVYQKLHSFMLIKQLLLKLYMEKGTVLQKYIGMLKYLAREQNRLQIASAQTRDRGSANASATQRSRKRADGTYTTPGSHSASSAALHRKYQQEAALIEDNVSKLMRCIFRVVFNKWTMFTYHEVTHVQKPRVQATSKIFMAIDRLICRRKLICMSQLHLYSLCIKEITQNGNEEDSPESLNLNHIAFLKRQGDSITLDQKLKRSRISLKLCESILGRFRFKALQSKFAQWKSNCAIIEWRLNQGLLEGNPKSNERQAEQIQILLKEPGMIDSQHLQTILEELRESRDTTNMDEKMRIRQMMMDFQNARGSEGVKQFFQNYYTPKSAAIQQKLQKPWEIKMQRDEMILIAIYRGATRSETILSATQMPTEKDPTLLPLINTSFDRLMLMRALRKWQKVLREPVGTPEKRALLRFFEKIRKRRIAKGFLIWKHSGEAKDTYTMQSEIMDQKTLETLSQVGKHLNKQLTKTKELYKEQVRIKVVNRVMTFMRNTNPVLEAFNIWKQETLELLAQKYAIRQTIADKEELRQQYELLNQRNRQKVEEHVNLIQKTCFKKNGQVCHDCASIQIARVEALAEIKINENNYRELDKLVGAKGMQRLLGSTHHIVQNYGSQLSPTSSAFGSSSNGGSSMMKFAADKKLERAGGGRVCVDHRRQQPQAAIGSSEKGENTRADALAQAIEKENQKLRDKNEKVKEQLKQKKEYIEAERRKYQAKIAELKQYRDQLMDQYEASMSGYK